MSDVTPQAPEDPNFSKQPYCHSTSYTRTPEDALDGYTPHEQACLRRRFDRIKRSSLAKLVKFPGEEPALVTACRWIVKEHSASDVDNFSGLLLFEGMRDYNFHEENDEGIEEVEGGFHSGMLDGLPTNPMLVDATTANLVVQIYDAINEPNRVLFRTKWLRGTMKRCVDLCWKLTRKS